jgi:hypothetical protein
MTILADRATDGITVKLFWDETAAAGADILVTYEDRQRGVAYTLRPPRERALDAFHHPNAYLELACTRVA